jgi:hypothetical protein
MPIYQTAHYQVKSSAVDKVKKAIETFVKYVKDNEPETRFYAAWQERDDPTRFVHLFIFEMRRHTSGTANPMPSAASNRFIRLSWSAARWSSRITRWSPPTAPDSGAS